MLSMLKSRSEVNSVRTVLLMLRDFLDAVGRGKESDRLIFENFFADDVIYTSSSGIAINKEDIMKILDVDSPHRFKGSHTPEDIKGQHCDHTVIVNFCMVMHSENRGRPEISYFCNPGTFVNRSGRWQLVRWGARRDPACT